ANNAAHGQHGTPRHPESRATPPPRSGPRSTPASRRPEPRRHTLALATRSAAAGAALTFPRPPRTARRSAGPSEALRGAWRALRPLRARLAPPPPPEPPPR